MHDICAGSYCFIVQRFLVPKNMKLVFLTTRQLTVELLSVLVLYEQVTRQEV